MFGEQTFAQLRTGFSVFARKVSPGSILNRGVESRALVVKVLLVHWATALLGIVPSDSAVK